ncbi:MFS transporter [Glaciibacter sp. 2TAF33]|uniref:MFS transporter n=1 Tax=Glaciibacter sp. 2TAF33 TaxID=3233015 RepID=UPI003F8F9462
MNIRILVLAFGMVASGMNSLLVAGLLPAVARSLDTTEAAVGISVSVLALTYALTAPFIPIAFSRFGRRAILIAAMIVFLIGVLLSAFAWDIWSFYLARAISGLGAAAYAAQAIAAAIEISPPGRKGAAASWVSMGFAVSMALGVPVGTLLGNAFGYPIAFLLTALIGVVTVIALMTMRLAIPVHPVAPSVRQQFRPLASPPVLAVLAFTFFYSVSFFIVLIYLSPILVSAAGVDVTMVAAALAVFGVCNVVSMAIGGRLIDRFGGLAVIVVCLMVMSVVTPLLGAPVGALGAFLSIAAFGLTGSVIGPATNVVLGRMHPQNPATVVGANMSAVQLGAAVGGAAGAAILTAAGASWTAFAAGPPAITAAFICCGVILVRRARKSTEQATTRVAA